MNERAFDDYQLPDHTVVKVDASAAKGLRVIDFTLKGGKIVQAIRVNIPQQDLMSACRDVDLAKQDIERAIAAATTGNELRAIARLAREFAQAFEWLDDKAMGKWEGLK